MRLDRFRRLVRPGASHSATASGPNSVADIDVYAEALHDLMMRMDRTPTASFQHSYAGEFDVSDFFIKFYNRPVHPPFPPLLV